jgi:hypothetical protein
MIHFSHAVYTDENESSNFSKEAIRHALVYVKKEKKEVI